MLIVNDIVEFTDKSEKDFIHQSSYIITKVLEKGFYQIRIFNIEKQELENYSRFENEKDLNRIGHYEDKKKIAGTMTKMLFSH